MTYLELAALLEEGDTATAIRELQEQYAKPQFNRYLSAGEIDLIEAKLARVQRLQAEAKPKKKRVEAVAEEPVVDSEPEPKAAPKKARRSVPSGRGKKGK